MIDKEDAFDGSTIKSSDSFITDSNIDDILNEQQMHTISLKGVKFSQFYECEKLVTKLC